MPPKRKTEKQAKQVTRDAAAASGGFTPSLISASMSTSTRVSDEERLQQLLSDLRQQQLELNVMRGVQTGLDVQDEGMKAFARIFRNLPLDDQQPEGSFYAPPLA